MLLEKGANPNALNKDSESPLMIASIENNETIALKLVEAGGDVLLENHEKKNSLELAQPELREELLELARKLDKK
jgi:ankyrin repeat protein